MSVLPRRPEEAPPAVEHLRGWFRGTRVGGWIVAHKSLAAIAVGRDTLPPRMG